jgi:hypothetical protein
MSLKAAAIAIVWRAAIALDQFGNWILGGKITETISSRCFREQGHCALCRGLCWLLHQIDPDHCARAAERAAT